MSLDTTTHCPPITELERLLRGRVSETRAAVLADHIGSCAACQRRLDDLTAGAKEITDNYLEFSRGDPPSDSAYWKALAAVENDLRATVALVANGSNRAAAEPRIDFLQPSDEPGRLGKLGPFGIIRVIGRGGMGVVLHANDPILGRDVAVKVIDPRFADQEVARQRFCREARAAASVTHENLVAVHQVDEDEASGLPYLVMQLINGESLEQRLKRVGRLSAVEVARIGMQAAAGLAAAHAAGLIHRDIKPANILLESGTDRVKLTDFGLARAAEDVKLTRSGFVAGSPLYMAPEQARGDELDHRTDLFSLGSVLYEAATGHPPFEAKTPLAVLRRITDDTPPPVHHVNPLLPEWLGTIISRLLEKNPADRYQTAAEVAQAFATALARERRLSPLDVPAEVCAGSRTSPAHRTRRPLPIRWGGHLRRVGPWLGGAAVGATLAALLISPTPVERVVEVPAPAPAPESLPPGPTPRAVFPNDSAVWAIAFLPGEQVALGTEDGSVRIKDLRRANVFKALEPRQNGTIWSIDVSSDGKFLVATCDDSRVTVWNLETFAVAHSFPQPTSTKAAVFHPDGQKLATGDRNSTIRIWDLTAEIPDPLSGHRGTVNALAYSPDGRRLATTGWDGTLRIWDTQRGTQLLTLAAHDGDAWSVSFGGGGRRVASGGADGFVRVWDVETGQEVFAYRTGRAVHAVRFAPDGTTLAAGGRDGNLRVWDVK